MAQGRIVALHLSVESGRPPVPVQEATAVCDFGLEGDRHAGKGNERQLLLMDKESLDAFGLEPGIVKENITVEGLDLAMINTGQLLLVGNQVSIEATGLCEACGRMDAIRPGLREEMDGRRGVLAIVRSGGTLKVGDTIRVEE